MSRSPVLFRVDADPILGHESMARCQVFASALQRRRRQAYFLSRVEPASHILPLKRGGNEYLPADQPIGTPADLQDTLREVRRLAPAAVVVDSPLVTRQYLETLDKAGVLVVTFDHLARFRFPSGLVVNPLLGPGKEDYDHGSGTQLLLGERYAMIRAEVRRQRPQRAQEPSGSHRILVALGDHDPARQTLMLAKTLLNAFKGVKVDVAVRSHHPDLEALQALVEQSSGRLELATEPQEIVQKLTRCHLAIAAGNGWSMDLACLGVPQILIVQQECFWPSARRLEEEGAATCLGSGENVSVSNLKQVVQDLLDCPLERQAMSRCARQLIDGRGPDRLILALEVMLHPYRNVLETARAA